MKKYCDIEKFSKEYLHEVGTQFDNAISEMQKDRFCVNAIPISENATNGDVIKKLFSSCETRKPREDVIEITLDGVIGIPVMLDWWDASYKGKEDGK
jgi:hypothetical protein